MISFKDIMRRVLTETMSFRQLWNASDPARKKRSLHVKPKQMTSRSVDAADSFVFSYKSEGPWSTTGQRWHGYVKLMKEGMVNNQNIEIQDVECMVDCDCPDYRYRFAYGNNQAGASEIGSTSWNGNNGAYPDKMGVRVGLCKHLMSLVDFLGTKVEPVAPEPEDTKVPTQKKAGAVKKGLTPQQQKNLPKKWQPYTPPKPGQPSSPAKAPEPPDDFYSDTRSGDIMEAKGASLYERLKAFCQQNPEFTVEYEDTK